jgi:hypothetical protein
MLVGGEMCKRIEVAVVLSLAHMNRTAEMQTVSRRMSKVNIILELFMQHGPEVGFITQENNRF